MSKSFVPEIGKNVIETLTVGMYDAPHFVYREYVQNSADSIDSAVFLKILPEREKGKIDITILEESRTIIIEDNGTGIESKNVRSLLGNIAQSTKNRYADKGFRGIGRLGALGYCNKLTYETSYKGEKSKSIMIWDAKNLREILHNPDFKLDAAQVISAITDYSRTDEDQDTHYFRIILEGVTNNELLDVEQVENYLSMVAPVPFNPKFTFSKLIYKKAKEDKVVIDEYSINLNRNKLFKGYKNEIYDNKKVVDEVIDIDFISASYDTDLLFWGWYGITRNMQYIPGENNEKFIRLRKHNIQIGLDSRLDKFHKKDTGNRYFIGEIYAVHKELQPNGRRDFFIENLFLNAFTKNLTEIFKTLYELFYDFSKKNSAFKFIEQANDAEEKLKKEKKDKGNSATIDQLEKEVEQKRLKANRAKEKLLVLYNKYAGKTLAKVITEKVPYKQLAKNNFRATQPIGRDSDIAKGINDKLSDPEQKLLSFIYNVIKSSQANKTASKIISTIQNELQLNYLKKR